MNKNFIKYLILLSSIEFISYIKAESQCTTNADCVKYNVGGDNHVCIRFDGHNDYVCYLDSEAYCDSDAACQKLNKDFKFCYTPPWLSNSAQKQCFTLHGTGGTCLENSHCAEGLSCSNHVCTTADINAEGVKNPVSIVDSKTEAKTDSDDKNSKSNDDDKKNDKDETTSKTDSKSTKQSQDDSMYIATNSTSSVDLDYTDYDSNKKKPIEIIGLPLWAFILLITIPIVFLIALLWGLAVGRRSYREEEERKKGIMALKNNKKDMDINYHGGSTENLLPKSSSDLNIKDDMLKSYVTSNETKETKSRALASNASSNSTIGNNLTAITVDNQLKSKSSQQTLEIPINRKPRKSNASTTTTHSTNAKKQKKPKSVGSSEYSDSNSHKGLLAASGPMGISAAESGVYSNYFGGSNPSTVVPGYFGQNPIPTDPAINAFYYQQFMAAQAAQMQAAQIQAAQMQAAQAQTFMNPYLIDQGLVGMPTVEMMQQYQQMYGMGMGMGLPPIPTVDTQAAAAETTDEGEAPPPTTPSNKKHKHKK